MKLKISFPAILLLFILVNANAQGTYQTFASSGFKTKCGCKFYSNDTFKQIAKQKGVNNILASYVCAENENNPETGVINNINIYDESRNYQNIQPSNYFYFEKKYLEKYAANLKNSGIPFTYTNFQGVAAVEYSFDQQGLPTKAIIFLKNKKSYLIQTGTRKDLSIKFKYLKSNFIII